MSTTTTTAATTEQNIATVKLAYDAFSAGDLTKLIPMFDEKIEFKGGAAGVLSGNYKGRDAMTAYITQLGQETGGTMRVEPNDFSAVGNLVFVRQRVIAERKGVKSNLGEVLVFTLEGSLIRKMHLYVGDFAQYQAFWN